MHSSRERKIFSLAIIISLLLHVVGIILLNIPGLFSFASTNIEPEAPPIVLEFERPPEPQPQQQQQQPLPEKYYQIEENPNANEMKPTDADILAEKASISSAPLQRDNAKQDILPENDSKTLFPKELDQQQLEESESNREEIDETELTETEDKSVKFEDLAGNVSFHTREFSKELLASQPETASKESLQEASEAKELPAVLDEFKGDLVGDVTMSTYEWKWAPWLLAFKQKFYRHLYVPSAYQIGLIEGYTEVWMKISRDGRLVDHKLVGTQGHPTLKESTLNAFLASVPWKALPSDFPDQYLELRVRVIYPNLKEYFRRVQ